MLRLKNLANKYQKRTCRPIYANTQATPYSATLWSATGGGTYGFRATDGTLQLPGASDTAPLADRTKAAYTSKGSLLPGMVAVRVKGTQSISIGTGANVAEQPFGLLANFVGGDLDEGFSGDSLQNEVGVWRGPDAVFEILAPAFDDDGTGSPDITGQSLTTALGTVGDLGTNVYLYAGQDGRLVSLGTPGNRVPVARLVERVSASRIIVDLVEKV